MPKNPCVPCILRVCFRIASAFTHLYVTKLRSGASDAPSELFRTGCIVAQILLSPLRTRSFEQMLQRRFALVERLSCFLHFHYCDRRHTGGRHLWIVGQLFEVVVSHESILADHPEPSTGLATHDSEYAHWTFHHCPFVRLFGERCLTVRISATTRLTLKKSLLHIPTPVHGLGAGTRLSYRIELISFFRSVTIIQP